MSINGIGAAGYPAWYGARKAENSEKSDFGANVKSAGNVVHIEPDTSTIRSVTFPDLSHIFTLYTE